MCLIVYNKSGRKLNKSMLRIAHENNPHGFGIMWHDEFSNRVRIIKNPVGSFDDLLALTTKFENRPYVLHLRWRTRGKISRAQSHPHRIFSISKDDDHDLWMMHNGTFRGFDAEKERSDTKMFANKMRGVMMANETDFDAALAEMKPHVNSFDKIVFLDNSGNVTFVNEKAGEWLDNGQVWISNTYSFQSGYRNKSDKFLVPSKTRSTKASEDDYDSEPFWKKKKYSGGVYVARGTGTIKSKPEKEEEEDKRIKNKKKKNFNVNYRVRGKDGNERIVEVKVKY